MPLDNAELLGTGKDGSLSSEYCQYCYQSDEFPHSGIALVEMKETMTKLLDKEKLPKTYLKPQ
jgi:hypothetical protein